ncbi:leukocyte receptor cluster member 9-like [Ptychodera flava]|uniref:leukocyte receptor cluster member 9-like n=1 Tax=Ptychodera flava TaxID=63121 RepID=UPI00396A1764
MAEGTSNAEEQNQEIEALQSIYGAEFERLRNGDGCYSNKIRILLTDTGVSLTFSLKDTYPDSPPRVEIDAQDKSGISNDLMDELCAGIYEIAKQNKGTAMIYTLVQHAKDWLDSRSEIFGITMATDAEEREDAAVCRFYLEGKCRFGDRCRNKHPGGDAESVQEVKEEELKPEKKDKKRDVSANDEEIDTKKPPMKTADDVISRILWDKSVPAKHFSVGYLDRFLGIIENSFSAFDWTNHLASLDHQVLAIPRHRIHYFKYKDVIVWDKNTRLDNVFGSTGSGVTISDVIAKYKKLPGNSNHEDHDSDDDDEGDSDIDAQCEGAAEVEFEVSDQPSAVSSAQRHVRKDPNKPNYFLALRITDKDILAAVQQVQEKMVETEPRLASCCIPPTKLHLTICTMRIDSESQMKTACGVLKDLKHEISRLLPPATLLKFDGLNVFRDRVLYAAPQPEPALLKFYDHITSLFRAAGVNLAGTRDEYTPHMTIVKLTRSVAKQLRNPCLEEASYYEYLDDYFGTQAIESLHLCSMGSGQRHDGFYQTAMSLDVYDEQ